MSQFGSSETKLKQMQIKLQQLEQDKMNQRRELTGLKRELNSIGMACPTRMANEIVQLV